MHRQTRILICACAMLAACSGGGGGSATEPTTLTFEPLSPPQIASDDVLVAGHGDIVITADHVSRNGGATWAPNPTRPLGAVVWTVVASPTTAVMHTVNAGLVRWELATDVATPIAGAPAYAASFRYDPKTDTVIAFDPQLNALSRYRSGAWTAATLPLPAPDACCPYIADIDMNGDVALLTSSWGVHRSLDGGVTWEHVPSMLDVNARDVIALPDGRFLIGGGISTPIFDATGLPSAAPPGPALPGELGKTQVCGDGAILVDTQVTVDLGASFQPLFGADGPVATFPDKVVCGGGRFYAHVESAGFGRRLVRIDAAGAAPLLIGGWEDDVAAQGWGGSTLPLARAGDGTVMVNGLSWRPGDERWRLGGLPNGPIASAPGGAVYGFDAQVRWRSDDGGDTWSSAPFTPSPVMSVFVNNGGALYGGQINGDYIGGALFSDAWIYRSDDDGSTFSQIYMGTRIRESSGNFTGDAHRLIGLDPGGALVAHDGVSDDDAATWRASAVPSGETAVHVTPGGDVLTIAITTDVKEDVWRVYGEAGTGSLRSTLGVVAGGTPVAASSLRHVVFDKDGHAYVAAGAPFVQVWRSTTPAR